MTKNLATTIVTTILALIAFAANSVLCRIALNDNYIDAGSFTVIRLVSGIVMLFILLIISSKKSSIKITSQHPSKGSWLAALMLFTYALAFSFGYISLETGTGALILFASVQLTMIISSYISGTKLLSIEWLGVIVAFTGFIYLTLPSLTTPSFIGFIFMLCAGIAWGFYTLLGRDSKNPLSDTAYNFLRTFPLVIILALFTLNHIQLSTWGVMLAVLSGALASGIGYYIWYMALNYLSSVQAAVLQLLVPIIAAAAGVVFAGEFITQRLVESSLLIICGILLVIFGRYLLKK